MTVKKPISPEQRERGQRLRIGRMLTTLNGKEFAKQHCLHYFTINKWETGKINVSRKTASKCTALFLRHNVLCSVDWILTGIGAPPKFINDAHKTGFSSIETTEVIDKNLSEELKIFSEIETFKRINKNSLITMIRDSTMEPFYSINDYVGGIEIDPSNTLIYNKRNCIVVSENNEVVVRKILVKEKKLSLIATNPFANCLSPISKEKKGLTIYPIIYHRRLLSTHAFALQPTAYEESVLE